MRSQWRICSLLLGVAIQFGTGPSLVAEEPIDYATQIKPLLAERCFACHGALKQEANLRLDSGSLILRGGDSGEVLVPGRADESLLIEKMTGGPNAEMPPEGEGTRLNEEQATLIRNWINLGARFPEDDQPQLDPRNYWSYQPVIRPTIPAVESLDQACNPVDAFIAAQHEQRNLTAVSPAEPHTILRRVYLDLIGLPPTNEELRAFLDNPSDDAYEAVVDKLLDSPQYGERWGRHWMDVWRYSDWYGSTAAKEIRNSQYHIWQWRDWIVESLNNDKGYDRMIHEMFAADELAPDDRDGLRALGYLARSWYLFNRTTWLIDTVEHANMAFLGATMKCARCHDHKYDPLLQTDYYRFRAIFEPHDVRTDPFPGEPDIKKKGLPRVYDKELDVPTYLFVRGDERAPDKENPIEPGVADVFGQAGFDIQEVALPLESRYLELQPQFVEAAEDEILRRLNSHRDELSNLETDLKGKLSQIDSSQVEPQPWRTDMVCDVAKELFQRFDVDEKLSEHWESVAGKWKVEDGLLRPDMPSGSNTSYLATKREHPTNFYARVEYRTLKPGTYRSIGFSFDFQSPGDSQDIYTSTGDKEQSVQAFHRTGGKEVYPYSGVVKTPITLGETTTLEVVARGRDLRIWLNDELKLDYIMPKERQPGKFALWVYRGTAEFLEVELHKLEPSSADLYRETSRLELLIQRKKNRIQAIEAELDALHKRIAAERAKHQQVDENTIEQLALVADQSEKKSAQFKAERNLLETQHYLSLLRDFDPSALQGVKPLLADAQQRQTEAEKELRLAEEAMASAKGEYQPLGKPYPATSTGRRLALARWMTDRSNPRTARIAVNHMWLRHFGRAIVPTVADFGVRSQPRSHPQLLDWMAAELMDHSWQMKPLHKLMVMSQAYRRSSAAGNAQLNQQLDPENRYLWRMNSRRIEAEAIRDSILYSSGQIDLTMGGPSIPQTEGQVSNRRSLYFQLTPDNKMEFLAQFDVASPLQCYERKASVVPHQALALSNSVLAQNHARHLARKLSSMPQDEFVTEAFCRVLSRWPNEREHQLSSEFLGRHQKLFSSDVNLTPFLPGEEGVVEPAADPHQRARENFVQVLLNHNDFVTIR